jgi:hypothetical protein
VTLRELCKREECDPFEHDALAWQLVMIRARAAYEQLRPQPKWTRRKRREPTHD